MTALTVPDVLRRAEQVVAERGHCKGDFINDLGQVCPMGAINIVICGDPDDLEIPSELSDFQRDVVAALAVGIASDGLHPHARVANWNDDETRTEAEVRAALLAAAQRAEAA
jgi:hypothetical protein